VKAVRLGELKCDFASPARGRQSSVFGYNNIRVREESEREVSRVRAMGDLIITYIIRRTMHKSYGINSDYRATAGDAAAGVAGRRLVRRPVHSAGLYGGRAAAQSDSGRAAQCTSVGHGDA